MRSQQALGCYTACSALHWAGLAEDGSKRQQRQVCAVLVVCVPLCGNGALVIEEKTVLCMTLHHHLHHVSVLYHVLCTSVTYSLILLLPLCSTPVPPLTNQPALCHGHSLVERLTVDLLYGLSQCPRAMKEQGSCMCLCQYLPVS